MVVDDHALLTDAVRALLSTCDDIEMVGEAFDGNEAIDKIRELHPDVTIMDVSMPGINGFEATRRIHAEMPDMKVLIFTQHDYSEYRVASEQAGAAGYLSKKAGTADLLDAIRSVFHGESYF